VAQRFSAALRRQIPLIDPLAIPQRPTPDSVFGWRSALALSCTFLFLIFLSEAARTALARRAQPASALSRQIPLIDPLAIP